MSELEKRDEPITAQHIVAAVVDTMKLYSVPVTGRARGMLGRQSKELLLDGFPPETILAAAVLALRRGEPHVAHHIAQDIALAQAGQGLTRSEYRAELQKATTQLRLAPGEYEAIYGRKP